MPSQRRIRVFGVLAAVIVVIIWYTHRSAQQSDQQFYSKTVQGLDNRAAAKQRAETDAKLNIQLSNDRQKIDEAAKKSRLLGVQQERMQKDGDLKKDTPVPKEGEGPILGAPKRWDVADDNTKLVKDEKTEEEKDIELELNTILKRSPIIIFSKTYCPFSKKAKAVFAKYSITPSPFIVELDQHEMGPKLQEQLKKITGRGTVPNVLVSGQSIGGGDDVAALDDKGELIDKIKSLGGKRIMEISLKKT